MQVQNVSAAISNLCSALAQSASDTASWLGHKISDWSHAAYDLLVRIASATKEYLGIAWNYVCQGFNIAKDYLMAHQTEAMIVGVTAGVVLATVALYSYCCRGTPAGSATTVPATTVPATTVPATTVPATTVPATTVPASTTV